MANINIKTNEIRFPVARDLYGLFFEDINRGADSGMYPEQLRNRSFEDSIVPDGCTVSEDRKTITSPTGWETEFNNGEGWASWDKDGKIPPTDIPAWYTENAEMTLERVKTLNKARRAALDVKFKKGGKITNIGYCGVSFEDRKAYKLLLFANAIGAPADIAVSVESKDGRKVYASETLRIANGYAKYECTFVADGTDSDAVFVIRAEKKCEILFGFSSLMPCDTYNGHGLRKDLMEKLAAMKPKFLRFPGGCIVEGFTEESMLRFSKTVGEVWERPTNWNLWGYRTTNGIGFHEYLQICEDLDMEPMYVFNCGMTCQARKSKALSDDFVREMIEEAKNAVEYARGGVTTKWGALRAKMGHPAPFKMTYLEIGNENWGPEYLERYNKCYKELKELYPDITFICNSHLENETTVEVADEHFYSTPEFFAENMHRYDTYPRTGPKIFVGEYAVTNTYTATVRSAASEAMFMIGMENNQDIVTLESYAPLFENVNYKAWNPNLLVFNNHQSYAIPSYYAWKIFGSHRGKNVLASSYDSEKVYRFRGGKASLFAPVGMKFRNSSVKFIEKGLGNAEYTGNEFTLTAPTAAQLEATQVKNDAYWDKLLPVNAFLLSDTPASEETDFSIEAFVKEGENLYIGMNVVEGDENKEILNRHKGFTWCIEQNTAFVKTGVIGGWNAVCDRFDIRLNFGEYNTFAFKLTKDCGKLFINGELVKEFIPPFYEKVTAAALADGNDIIVKLVNFSENEEKVEISLDCEVRSEYEIHRMSGKAEDQNSFDKPENICDVRYGAEGAAKKFTYIAPPFSVNALILKKK